MSPIKAAAAAPFSAVLLLAAPASGQQQPQSQQLEDTRSPANAQSGQQPSSLSQDGAQGRLDRREDTGAPGASSRRVSTESQRAFLRSLRPDGSGGLEKLESAQPDHPAYQRLIRARETYQAYAEHGGWPGLEGSGVVEEGETAPEIATLRQRLAFTGDLDRAEYDLPEDRETLTPALAEDIRGFQRRHGLKVDGVLGPQTRSALNVPAGTRLAQIEANIRHWTEIDVDFGQDYVLVNIPEFRLRAYENGREAMLMKVIVGAEYGGRTTPSFSDTMEHVIFRPYWMVPPTIATEEVATKPISELRAEGFQVVRDYAAGSQPLALTRANVDAVARGDLRIRQAAGPENALGLVKFMFPNEHAIYLHDTPADHLFDEAERDFSHGCIRVERPADFADWVLDRAAARWSMSEINSAMQSGDRRLVPLETEIPVHILYWTVWADESGAVNFREDIYDRFDVTT